MDQRNPELACDFFNAYLHAGSASGLVIGEGAGHDGDTLAISDPETGEVVGYIPGSTEYELTTVQVSRAYLVRGMRHHPERLDMYFGTIHILTHVADYKAAGDALIEVLDRSEEKAWVWF